MVNPLITLALKRSNSGPVRTEPDATPPGPFLLTRPPIVLPLSTFKPIIQISCQAFALFFHHLAWCGTLLMNCRVDSHLETTSLRDEVSQ